MHLPILEAKTGINRTTWWRVFRKGSPLNLNHIEKLEAAGIMKPMVEAPEPEPLGYQGYFHQQVCEELIEHLFEAKKELHPGLNQVLFEKIDKTIKRYELKNMKKKGVA